MNTKNMYTMQILLIGGSILSSFFSSASFADPVAVGESQAFVVSAYYSPLPNQKTYVWGSYEADIRMNGHGVRGADFTKVYPGMMAAPPSYPFGTKIFIPGIGTGTVHDRGGAIQEWGHADRIDVWMGWGDDGRIRALNWGMREVTGEIMPKTTEDSVVFSVLPASHQVQSLPDPQEDTSLQILSTGSRGEAVTNLQEFLQRKGYLSVSPTGYFGEQTANAVFAFQKESGIVSSWEELGAGVFGPKTRAEAEKVWDTPPSIALKKEKAEVAIQPVEIKKNTSAPYNPEYLILQPNLQTGDTGESVQKLQMVLEGLGHYSSAISSVYDTNTQKAVFAYQKEKNIVSSMDQIGAGRFGPQTYSALVNDLIQKRRQIQFPVSQTDHITAEQIAMRKEKIQIERYAVQYGDTSKEVKQLQEELIARGFLSSGLNTGYYGEKTHEAISAYRATMG